MFKKILLIDVLFFYSFILMPCGYKILFYIKTILINFRYNSFIVIINFPNFFLI